jgi:acyl-CoA synthetase (AMP-forming)/AMP-acid ligase II
MVNLSAIVDFHARRDPDRLAILYADQRIGYRELADRAGVLAGLLAQLGVGPGDIVAAFMKNSSAFIELAIAVSHVGGVFLPLNFRLALEEAAYIVEHAGARHVFVDCEFAEHAAGLPGVVVVDEQSQRDSRALTALRPDVPPRTYRTPDDLFRLMYTSGTTDRPKGVMHTYTNFYWKCMDHVAAIGLSASDRLLIVGPLYHVGAFDLPGLAVLWLGGMLCIHRDFDAAQALAAIECERLTGAWLAPVMLTRILNLEGRGKFDLSSLKWCIGGGEKTPEARIKDFGNLFRNGRYIDAYGLTETCSGDTLMEAGREIEKIGSTGRATPHVEIEIRDPSGGKLGPGLEGEICLRGPKITKGYWRDPEKTKSSFFGDWFRSGDIGHLDAEGFLYITDRKKDMIKSGGENIASSEVERVIYQMPEVSEAAVIGLPDDKWGERPVAVVVLREGATLDYPTLEAHCGRHLARFKLPKELHLRSSLPRNPSGKVLKRVLRDEFMAVSPKRRNASC